MQSQLTSDKRANLYLLGFMGTGKSVLGTMIAESLNMKFLDSDEEIEKKYSMEIKDIFAQFGEDKFRQYEKEFIQSGHPATGCVISCGGGLCCRDGMPELLKSKGVCVVLFTPAEEILRRVSQNDKRPLLNVENPLEKIKSLLAVRTPYYLKSGTAIATSQNLTATKEHILRIYEKQSDISSVRSSFTKKM